MLFVQFVYKAIGKTDCKIDSNISTIYFIRLCYKYGRMLIRGFRRSLFYSRISSLIYIGRGVELFEKRSMMIGKNTKINDYSRIDALSHEGVVIGEDVVFGKRNIIECSGSIKEMGLGIRVGARTSFGADCFFGAAGGIRIGCDVIAGQNIRFHSENHNFADVNILIREQGVNHQGIEVGDNCWIGAGVTFLDGSQVGSGCVVAAGSVVRGSFGDNTVIGGVPAKIIKKREDY